MPKKLKPKLIVTSIIVLFLTLASVVFLLTLKKSAPVSACGMNNLSGNFDPTENLATFEDHKVSVPLAGKEEPTHVLGESAPSNRWIEVDLSEQKLRAWDGNSLFLETLVSTGLPWTPTPQGEFRIWIKLRYTKMEGGTGRYYYFLPNVPFVMFFEGAGVPRWRGYSLHGTYWHHDFGKVHSHGCVNLPTDIAERLYWWTGPVVPAGKNIVYSSDDNPGTRIVIHE